MKGHNWLLLLVSAATGVALARFSNAHRPWGDFAIALGAGVFWLITRLRR